MCTRSNRQGATWMFSFQQFCLFARQACEETELLKWPHSSCTLAFSHQTTLLETKGHYKWLTSHFLICSFPIFLPPLSLRHFRGSVPNDEFSLGTEQRQCITETGGRKSRYEQLTSQMKRQARKETKPQSDYTCLIIKGKSYFVVLGAQRLWFFCN